METYDNSNRGSLWVNANKNTLNHPDWMGRINVNGVDYWLSAWKGRNITGKSPDITLSVREEIAASPVSHLPADYEDSIPL